MKATNTTENTTTETKSVITPSSTTCKIRFRKALQEINDALSGKKIFTF